LIHRLLVNVPFCCCKRLLHLRICLLFPLIMMLFWALFFLILPRDPNGKGQPKNIYCLLVGEVFCGVFLLYSIIVYMNVKSRPFSAYKI
jgi:hypothetical protein